MFGEAFMRDFFGLRSGETLSSVARYERSVLNRALKLAEGQPPEANLAPYVELLQLADRLKLDVVRRK